MKVGSLGPGDSLCLDSSHFRLSARAESQRHSGTGVAENLNPARVFSLQSSEPPEMSFHPVFALSHVAHEQVKGLWVVVFRLPDEHWDAKFTANRNCWLLSTSTHMASLWGTVS